VLVWEAMGVVSLAHDVDAVRALAMLRAQAQRSGLDVDDVAAAVLESRLDAGALPHTGG
jgi:hypothetical protein